MEDVDEDRVLISEYEVYQKDNCWSAFLMCTTRRWIVGRVIREGTTCGNGAESGQCSACRGRSEGISRTRLDGQGGQWADKARYEKTGRKNI